MGCKARFAANSPAIGKKCNAADRPNPCDHGRVGLCKASQRVLQRVKTKKSRIKMRLLLKGVKAPITVFVPA
jgi:hypothetical protein